jgi:hypothetical protein
MADVSEVLSAFGMTAEIAIAAAAAIADPTSANISGVVDAYATNGQLVPTKLMAYLIQINGERHPEDPYSANVFPWLFAGAAILAYFMFRNHGHSPQGGL